MSAQAASCVFRNRAFLRPLTSQRTMHALKVRIDQLQKEAGGKGPAWAKKLEAKVTGPWAKLAKHLKQNGEKLRDAVMAQLTDLQ